MRGEERHETEHPNTGSRVDMRRFDVRLSTFNDNPLSWSLQTPSAEQLARVGLYYMGMEDRVRCFSCGVELEEWGEEDPLVRHYMTSLQCSFLQQDFSDRILSLQRQTAAQQSQSYSNTSRRLHSFAHWPYSHIVTSYQLASVGFFYTGEGTKVKCFSCGLVVREWKRGDVPLLVHCRTNPDCQFIKTIIKGAPPAEQAPSPVLKTLTTSDSAGAANKPDFSDVQVRLKSFKKLSPAFPISRQQLSETGLYLLRLPDVMKCFRCAAVVQSWVEGDTAVEKHRSVSPACSFLAERFPSKLHSPPPEVDPNDLPAPQYNEQQLEMMARQQRQTSSSSSLLPPDLNRLAISQPATPYATPSLHPSSGYHSMAHPTTLSSSEHYLSGSEATSPLSPEYPAKATPYPTSSQFSSHSSATTPPTAQPTLSTGTVGGKSVPRPPSYPQASYPHTSYPHTSYPQTSPHSIAQQQQVLPNQ